jgi:hypothetical protein
MERELPPPLHPYFSTFLLHRHHRLVAPMTSVAAPSLWHEVWVSR